MDISGCDASGWLRQLKQWARAIKRDVIALWLAARDARVPWYAKALAVAVASYALSPIDLIPDFIPVLGYFDDAIIVPLGILLVVQLIPADVMRDLRDQAALIAEKPVSQAGLVFVVVTWCLLAAALIWWALPFMYGDSAVSATASAAGDGLNGAGDVISSEDLDLGTAMMRR